MKINKEQLEIISSIIESINYNLDQMIEGDSDEVENAICDMETDSQDLYEIIKGINK